MLIYEIHYNILIKTSYSWKCLNAAFNRPIVNGTSSKLIYWYNRWTTQLMSYWGNTTANSLLWGNRMVCECGMNNACVDPTLPCNCDKTDNVWRQDDGYLLNNADLPVTSLIIGNSGQCSCDNQTNNYY